MNVPPADPQPSAAAPSTWPELYGDALFRYALQRVRHRDAAEDLVQEALLAGLRGYSQFDHRSQLLTWLTGILRHKIMDHVAVRSLRGADVSIQDIEEEFFTRRGKWKQSPGKWDGDPLGPMVREEFYAVLGECLDSLPRRTAEIFMMRQTDRISAEVIREKTGLSATNICSILYRARIRLRECLSQHWFDMPGREKP